MKLLDVLGQHIALAGMLDDAGLQAERVLVEGYKLGVLYQAERGFGDGSHVAAYHKRRTHDAPHSEMHLFFVLRQAAAYL